MWSRLYTAETIKYSGELLAFNLTSLFNMFVSHCYIPRPGADFDYTFAPLLQNKAGDASDINKYRAIALSNSLSKKRYNNYYTTAIKHATCKQLKLARKPITTAIKLATTLQDLCKSCRVVVMSSLLQPFTDAYSEHVTLVGYLC